MACALDVEAVRGLAAFAVVLATLGDILLLAVPSQGRGAVEPCLNQPMSPTLDMYSQEGLREDVRLAIILLLPVEVFLAAASAWLLHVAPTRHLQHAAWCMVQCWVVSAALLTDQLVHCGLAGPHRVLNAALRSVLNIFSFTSSAALALMIQMRMERLNAGTHVGALRWCLVACVFLAVVDITVALVGGLGQEGSEELQPWARTTISCTTWMICCIYGLWVCRHLHGFHQVERQLLKACNCAPPRLASEARSAARVLRLQMMGILFSTCTAYLHIVSSYAHAGLMRPLPKASKPSLWIWLAPMSLDMLANAFAALTLSGALTGAIGAARAEELQRLQRHQRRVRATAEWRRHQGQVQCQAEREWASKVRELAGRGFSLEALLAFYDTLGGECMPHFAPERHTTADVVRQAIIPRTSRERCALSSQLMDGQETRPQKFITHTWSGRFADLVSAIAADALGEHEFAMVSYLLGHDRKRLGCMLTEAGTLSRSYWVCALSVNQHLGICDTIPQGSCDPATGLRHPSCDCGLPKALGDTPPTLADGRSIACEMNKFHDLVALLSAEDPLFEQVIAVDAKYVLFSRAWCVSEIATSHASGMQQQLKLMSAEHLQEHEHWLRRLAIQDMKASKPEDKVEILKHIPDVEAFNTQLQALLFEDLLPSWQALDASEQMLRAGRIVRWQAAATARGSVGVWSAGSKTGAQH